MSDHRAGDETAKYPESLCPILALPPSGRRVPPLGGFSGELISWQVVDAM
jgi:hypothetical protein